MPLLPAACLEPPPTAAEPDAALAAAVAAAGGILINEVMADPSASSDDNGEWIEVHNTGSASVNLQGWQIVSNNDAAHTIATSVTVAAGGYAVLAKDGNKKRNGGVTASYVYGAGIVLANAADWIVLRDAAGLTVDSVAWATAMPTGATRGVSDPWVDNVNVNGSNWHTATSVFGKGDKGTPGAQNDGFVAAVATVTVTPASASIAVGGTQQFTASATDANGNPVATTFSWTSSNTVVATVDASGLADGQSAGTAQIRATAPNGVFGEAALTVTSGGGGTVQLVINEVMADPAAATDDAGEWFEVHNLGTGAGDLQGWIIVSNNDAAHVISASVVVPAGGYAVLGRNGSTGVNGGVTLNYVYGTGLTLANASDWLALRDPSGATVDSVAWATAMPTGATRGVSDPTADNTDVKGANWHTATSVFGAGDKGTPGAQNDGFIGPPSVGEVVVRVLDIGQGDGNYITNGTSRVFIDGGPDTAVFRQHLDALGVQNTTVDFVIISHAHFDHYSGLRELFKTARGITIGYVFENKDASDAVTLASLRDSINARAARGELIYRDTDDPCGSGSPSCTFTLNGGAKLHILRPNPAGSTPNNRSAAVKLVGPDSASFTMWFAGDAEHEEIDWFDLGADYDLSPGMRVNVLKGDHHGSCNGIKRSYIQLLNPEWVTFSLGASNTFGHVHTQTKDLLRELAKPWYRTDQNGTITFRSPGTVGGGYTVSIERGVASMDGATDRTSSQTVCQNL
ncbi:MAG: lamin tail domain-containing protein [Gemmatimonadetes bacterium]|nr:lamin tail domain-containing protein [Gemmatimonadota bacterium]